MRLPLIFFFSLLICIPVSAQLNDCQINRYNKVVSYSGSRVVEYTELEIQINTAKGLSYADIEIPYSKGNSIKDLQAGIYDLSGNQIRMLKKKDIVRANAYSDNSFHSDNMTMSFKLLHNRYPYIIKYSYKTDATDYLYLAWWMPRSSKYVPVKEASLSVEVPQQCAVRIFQRGVGEAQEVSLNGKKTYSWTIDDVEFVERQKFGPQSQELQAQVMVMPELFNYGVKGNAASWQSFGEWLSALKANCHNLPESEKERVRQLTKDCNSELEKINTLYKYLQNNTRYVNVALDIGGLLPETAEYVCANRYGDCKALTNYMQALLNEVGIASVYTIVHAGQYPVKINTTYPSQQFNHVILCVPQANDTIWLECTDKTAPFGYLGTFTQNRTVLLVDGENSRLTLTPALNHEEVADSYVSTINMAADGTLQMETQATLRGRAFDYLKSLNDALPQQDKLDYIEELGIVEHADIAHFSLERTHADSSYINLTLHSKLNNAIEPIGERSLIKPIRPFYFKLDEPEQRTQELRFSYPFNVSDTLIYNLPRPIKRVSGLQHQQLDTDFGYYTKDVQFNEYQLIITRHISIKAGSYPVEEYEGFYEFMQACTNAELQKGIVEYF
ncbi:DUF3857 domain-containing transglutaminase family protein [Carboxylicivirga mesophila]|uniref:DUF3857 domain-containing transglutaminase family protein n=1 Tax=Carboxylicivirga mesophila TaxID=1166478 RepID=A0ABS5KCF6_9BACT|nr:DUF3857 domain-containing transglutaminase family protein [Carboxylicivirga mesophila]MBS2212724.1 DUF3857 domain-containing transglutaminase family protein [Carboxylicivirga mesophila]